MRDFEGPARRDGMNFFLALLSHINSTHFTSANGQHGAVWPQLFFSSIGSFRKLANEVSDFFPPYYYFAWSITAVCRITVYNFICGRISLHIVQGFVYSYASCRILHELLKVQSLHLLNFMIHHTIHKFCHRSLS